MLFMDKFRVNAWVHLPTEYRVMYADFETDYLSMHDVSSRMDTEANLYFKQSERPYHEFWFGYVVLVIPDEKLYRLWKDFTKDEVLNELSQLYLGNRWISKKKFYKMQGIVRFLCHLFLKLNNCGYEQITNNRQVPY